MNLKLWGIEAPKGKITEHFSWEEAVCRCGCGRIPAKEVVQVTAHWLEEVRKIWDRPIHINSWCRCPSHNRAVGGAPGSFHCLGMACDITVNGVSPFVVWLVLRTKYWGLGKLIGGLGRYGSFTHIDRRHVPAKWNGDR